MCTEGCTEVHRGVQRYMEVLRTLKVHHCLSLVTIGCVKFIDSPAAYVLHDTQMQKNFHKQYTHQYTVSISWSVGQSSKQLILDILNPLLLR